MDELNTHRVDRFAHNESWDEQRKPYIDRADSELHSMILEDRKRLNTLEAFKEQAKGGFVTLAALLGGGLLVVVLHILGIPV